MLDAVERQLDGMVDCLQGVTRQLLLQDCQPSTLDEIFTLLEPWLRLEQELSRQLGTQVLQVNINIENPF